MRSFPHTPLVAINRSGRDHFLRDLPSRQRAQLAPPNLPHENNRRIRPTQTLSCAVWNRALPFLSDVILNVDEIGALLDVVHAESFRPAPPPPFDVGGRQRRENLLLLALALAKPQLPPRR